MALKFQIRVSGSTFFKSPLWVLPFIGSCVQSKSHSYSLRHFHIIMSLGLQLHNWTVTRNYAVSKQNIAFLVDIGFWKEWKEHRPDSSLDSSSVLSPKAGTHHLSAVDLNFLSCKMRSGQDAAWDSSFKFLSLWLIFPFCKTTTVSLLWVKRESVLERNGFVNNVTVLQARNYGCCFFLKRLKKCLPTLQRFSQEKQNLKRFSFFILLGSFSRMLKGYLQLGPKTSVNSI